MEPGVRTVRKHVIQCRRIRPRVSASDRQRRSSGASSEDINRIINQRNNDLLSNVAILFGAREEREREIAAQRTFCIQIRLGKPRALGNGAR